MGTWFFGLIGTGDTENSRAVPVEKLWFSRKNMRLNRRTGYPCLIIIIIAFYFIKKIIVLPSVLSKILI